VVPSRAAQAGERYRVVQATQARLVPHVVDLVDAAMDAEDLAAGSCHFRHEGQAVEHPVGVERRLDVLQRADRDDVTGAQSRSQQKSQSDPAQ
jgi:hypothetical protein